MGTSIRNRILRVDLSTGRTWTEQPGEGFFRKYLGGRNLIAHYLLTEVPRGTDAFDPENRLIFATGPLTGIAFPGGGRHSVGGVSPLSGLFCEAEAGGYWGAELKQAGWDGIVIQGKAEKPVYLWIKDQEVEIRDAGQLWGQLTGPVEDQIREELGDPQIRVTQAGPAGEKLVRIACVMNDLNEAAGRGGLGAVMGAKNLKAIAVRGSTRVPVTDEQPFREAARWVAEETLGEGGKHYILHTYGTAGIESKQIEGHLITHNFRDGQLNGWDNLDGEAIKRFVRERMDRCFACSVACKKRVRIDTPRVQVDPKYGGPEYETFAAIGSNCGVTDLLAVCEGNQVVNALGLDSISAGNVIAWAMEMAELGILTGEDLGGDSLHFGSSMDLLNIIEKIAYRQGFGDVLAEGVLRAARKIGKNSESFAVHVKGLEVAMHDPRGVKSLRENYPATPTGGDHTGAAQKRTSLFNTVGLCAMLQYDADRLLELLNAATGWDMTAEELHEAYERGVTMARLFNLREGATTEDDRLPWRFHQPMGRGPLSDYRLPEQEVRELVEGYYQRHGWEQQGGKPYRDTVEYLGLSEIAAGLDVTAERAEPIAADAAPFVMDVDPDYNYGKGEEE